MVLPACWILTLVSPGDPKRPVRELEAEPRVVGAKDLGAGLGRKGGGVKRWS